MFSLESQKCKTHIITAVFQYFWGSESATNEKTSQSVTFSALKCNFLLKFHEIYDFLDSIHVRRARMGQQKLLFRVIFSCADATSAEKCPLRFCHRYNGFLKKSAPEFHENRQRIPNVAGSSRNVTFFFALKT